MVTTTRMPRRRFLSLVKRFLVSTTVVASGGLARAQQSGQPTTSKQALLGEPLEGPPDYTLVARFATYDVELEYKVDEDGKPDSNGSRTVSGPFKFMTRSWANEEGLDDNMLGPILELRPGQKFDILVKNQLLEEGEYENYGPPSPQPRDWFPVIDRTKGPSAFLHKNAPLQFPFFNDCTPESPIEDFYVDWPNVPKNYNYTNLHVHGLEVIPHLFYPQGTSNPDADYITIKPGGEYRYHFELTEDHPNGTFWYHPHRHNSVAIQAWGALAGLILIRGKTDEEVKAYGIETEIPFAVHDPHYNVEKYPSGDEPGVVKVGRFLRNQNAELNWCFLVTGKYQPRYVVKKNEVVRLRHLTATVENMVCFRIVKGSVSEVEANAASAATMPNHPFYVMASDGITYARPVEQEVMVTGGGERHDILLSFSEPGDYVVRTDFLSNIQFFGTGPQDQVLATFHVTDEDAAPTTAIADMRFTPGIPTEDAIQEHEIIRRRHFVFDLDGDTCTLPFPQFKINDRTYKPEGVEFSVQQGDVEEWILINPNPAIHPFHVHVNAFQVKEAASALVPDPALVPKQDMAVVKSRIAAIHRIDPADPWRDTFIIPPMGYLRVWTRLYSHYVGKTVFHCHFLAHEETGMIQNFLITPRSPLPIGPENSLRSASGVKTP